MDQRTTTIEIPHRIDRRQGPVALRRTADDADIAPYERFGVRPLSPTVGAELTGLDLSQPFDDGLQAEVHRALLEWKVVFFRDQSLTADQQIAFARQWGEIEQHPFLPKGDTDTVQRFEKGEKMGGYENEWHNDNTWRAAPSMGAVLRAVEVPSVGGDTMFADTAAAYDNLDDELKRRLVGLQATHDWINTFGPSMDPERRVALRAAFPTVTHPVVRTHPETGRPTLFVNPQLHHRHRRHGLG